MRKRMPSFPHYRIALSWRYGNSTTYDANIKLLRSTANANLCVAEWHIKDADTDHPSIANFFKYNPALIPEEYYSITAQDLMDWYNHHAEWEHSSKESIADRIYREKHWDDNFFTD